MRTLVDMSRATEALRLMRCAGLAATLTHVVVRATALAAVGASRPDRGQGGARFIARGTVHVGLSPVERTADVPLVVLPATDAKVLAQLVPELVEAAAAGQERARRGGRSWLGRVWLLTVGALRRLLVRMADRSLPLRRRLFGTFHVIAATGFDRVAPIRFFTGGVLEVGRIQERTVAVDGKVACRPTAWVTLHADVGDLDCAHAAGLLRAFQAIVEGDELLIEARAASGTLDLAATALPPPEPAFTNWPGVPLGNA